MGRINETKEFIPVRIAVLTVSDTRTAMDDRSGDTLVERLTAAGHVLADRGIVTDDRALIAGRLRGWIADPGVDVILTTGGTGLTGRDVTVEAHRDVYEKEIEAFGTVFTMVSMSKIGTSAVQSRACGGVAGGTYLFALPGSPGACRMPGTRSLSGSWTIGTGPAISWKSCRGWRSIGGGSRRCPQWTEFPVKRNQWVARQLLLSLNLCRAAAKEKGRPLRDGPSEGGTPDA